MIITGTTMVRNEGSALRRTLPSISKICDNIFTLIDDATTDGTEESVEKFAGKWERTPWIDFGANRTKSIERACAVFPDTDWVLIFDGHEEFMFGGSTSPGALKEYLENLPDDVDAVAIDQVRRGIPLGWQIRIIRPHIYYKGPVHHYAKYKMGAYFDGLTAVHHDEWMSQEMRDFRVEQTKTWSIEKMRPLAEAGDTRYVYHLTATYFETGHFNEALDMAEQYDNEEFTSERFGAYAFGMKAAIQSEQWNRGLSLAKREIFHRADYYFIRAWLHHRVEEMEEAGFYYGMAMVAPRLENPQHFGLGVLAEMCVENLERLMGSLLDRDEQKVSYFDSFEQVSEVHNG